MQVKRGMDATVTYITVASTLIYLKIRCPSQDILVTGVSCGEQCLLAIPVRRRGNGGTWTQDSPAVVAISLVKIHPALRWPLHSE